MIGGSVGHRSTLETVALQIDSAVAWKVMSVSDRSGCLSSISVVNLEVTFILQGVFEKMVLEYASRSRLAQRLPKSIWRRYIRMGRYPGWEDG